MKNAMQLKAQVKNLAKEYKITAQAILQNYMLERLLERITLSSYQSNFVIKGGIIIASLVGLASRSTMDLDATIQGLPLTAEDIEKALNEIISIELDDGVKFSLDRIEEIREGDIYGGLRIHMNSRFDTLNTPLKIDLSTGDRITPQAIDHELKLLLEPRSISILSYNLETILAEKLETILARGILNTRLRDFYDIYILSQLAIDYPLLLEALLATSQWRETEVNLSEFNTILKTIKEDPTMLERWKRYCNEFDYAKGIDFHEMMGKIKNLLEITIS